MNAFEDLMIIVEDKPVKLNVLGIMNVGGDEVIVITDCPALEIEVGQYDIFHLLKENGTMSIKDIEDEKLYNTLCDIWEERIQEDRNNDS